MFIPKEDQQNKLSAKAKEAIFIGYEMINTHPDQLLLLLHLLHLILHITLLHHIDHLLFMI